MLPEQETNVFDNTNTNTSTNTNTNTNTTNNNKTVQKKKYWSAPGLGKIYMVETFSPPRGDALLQIYL